MKKKLVFILTGMFHLCIFAFASVYILMVDKDIAAASVIPEATRENIIEASRIVPAEPIKTDTETVEDDIVEETISYMTEEIIEEPVPIPVVFSYHGSVHLNLRDIPSLSGEIIGKILPSTNGLILSVVDHQWVEVSYNDTIGYCSVTCLVYNAADYELLREATFVEP